jgi:hypothetical protein
MASLKIIRHEIRMLRYTGQHPRSNLLVVVETEHIISVIRVVELNVGTLLGNDAPTFAHQSAQDNPRLRAAPLAHAEAGAILIESGIFLDFSTSSAIAYSASAYAFARASSLDAPYASAPGTSGISAIQRPSASRSISNWNRKSRLLALLGGFR